MISFDSDLYTCFPNDELKNECRLCREKIIHKVGKDGYMKTSHVEQKKCDYNQVNQNYISYLIHLITDRPYPRPISKCFKCFGNIVYMWTNIKRARWIHTDLMCSNTRFYVQTLDFAKLLIINHLVNHGRIVIKTECRTCNSFHHYKMPKLSAIDKNPHLMLGGDMMNVDLGCIDYRNNLIGVLQVAPINRVNTRKKCIKTGLFLFELDIEEIIDKLDSQSLKNCILNNRNYINCKK